MSLDNKDSINPEPIRSISSLDINKEVDHGKILYKAEQIMSVRSVEDLSEMAEKQKYTTE